VLIERENCDHKKNNYHNFEKVVVKITPPEKKVYRCFFSVEVTVGIFFEKQPPANND